MLVVLNWTVFFNYCKMFNCSRIFLSSLVSLNRCTKSEINNEVDKNIQNTILETCGVNCGTAGSLSLVFVSLLQ